MAIVGLPGWSESGGSWVPLRNGMKKLIWKEVRVNGGSNIKEKVTYSTIPFYTSDSPLKQSGLLGLVTIISIGKN